MNRRTFVKLTGITALLPATYLLANDDKPQWISLKERQPRVGQKVVILYRFDPHYINIFKNTINTIILHAGEIIQTEPKLANREEILAVVETHRCCRDMDKRLPASFSTLNNERLEIMRTKDIKNVPWKKQAVSSTNANMWTMEINNPNIYWMPITEIPNSLPKMPKLITKESPYEGWFFTSLSH